MTKLMNCQIPNCVYYRVTNDFEIVDRECFKSNDKIEHLEFDKNVYLERKFIQPRFVAYVNLYQPWK